MYRLARIAVVILSSVTDASVCDAKQQKVNYLKAYVLSAEQGNASHVIEKFVIALHLLVR